MNGVNELLAVNRSEDFKLGVEDRFPLDLTSTVSQQWAAYETALTDVWDPENEVLWAGFDPARCSPTERQAGALVWSHRAWIDHSSMVESEAVLVRACLEPTASADFKYCLGMRAVERARSLDMCRITAERLDQYHMGSASAELERLLSDDLVRRVLHAETDLGAYVAAHLVAQATIDLRSWEQALPDLQDGLKILIELVIRDKTRMVDVAWTQLAEMTMDSKRATREAMASSTAYVLFSEEACGRQLPALLVPSPESEQIVAAHEVAANAGLGGLPAQSQHQIFDTAIVELRERMSELGIDLPEPTEHRL